MDQARIARKSHEVVRRWPRVQRAASRLHARLYMLSGGRILSRWFDDAPILVVHTTGRRSGQPRATPVLYLRDGNAYVVLAANAGADQTPAWWLNLQHTGSADIVVGHTRIQVRARVLAGEERDRVWNRFVAMYPQAEHYARFTDRVLPLAALDPDPERPVDIV